MRAARFVWILPVLLLAGSVLSAEQVPAGSAKQPWKVEFTVTELENGKVANEYHYSTLLRSPGAGVVSAGNQIPIQTNVNNTTSVQYISFGLKISCTVGESLQGITPAQVHFEFSNPVVASNGNSNSNSVHTIQGTADFALNAGKKDVIIIADDIVGKRQYQVAILATKL